MLLSFLFFLLIDSCLCIDGVQLSVNPTKNLELNGFHLVLISL